MMKRLFPYLLALIFCFGLNIVKVQAQDSTKNVPEEKKVQGEKIAPVKKPVASAPLKVKPVTHYYHKLKPAVGPLVVPSTTVTDTSKPVAQTTQIDPTQLNDKSLTGQYQYLLTKAYNYQQPLIAALWKNFTDTLNLARMQVKTTQAKLALQTKMADSLKATASSKELTLSESNAKADAISFFGIMMAKSSYNLVMIGLVVVLGVALFVVIATTAKHKHEAKHRTELYEEMDEEFKAFKAKAHEKELKLARELQTERNKLDELLGRG